MRGRSPGGRFAVTDVVVHIEGYPDSDDEERADLTARLRADLLAHDLDVAVPAADAPAGAKAAASSGRSSS